MNNLAIIISAGAGRGGPTLCCSRVRKIGRAIPACWPKTTLNQSLEKAKLANRVASIEPLFTVKK